MTHRNENLTTGPAADPGLVDMLTHLLDKHRSRCVPSARVDLDRDLWQQLDQLGLTLLSTSEQQGGSGGTILDSVALLGLAAGAGAAVPLAEHDLLAAWLLAEAGLPLHGEVRTAARPAAGGMSRSVPWGGQTDGVVALWHDEHDGVWRVSDFEGDGLHVAPEKDLSGLPRASIQFDLQALRAGTEVAPEVADLYALRGSLARCAQMAGAMEAALDVVVTYANERVQFGRPLGRFQAVQHLVVGIAAEVSLARAATDAAAQAVMLRGWGDEHTRFLIAAARSGVGHASSLVVRSAHQVLGAIGTTEEHPLHLLTTPVLAWRSDFGSMREWDAELTRFAVRTSRSGLWNHVAPLS
ncbi:acyl-CoA dehydrogenase family protein [Streptomyces sp. NBC_01320]|uniref:acyl-CoA dehydrogenase family protein n=1 Tax=Streptomyces sp. NBC_01320 TaxID=2903824 RepID=UPI002E15B022|nr:acyl-CoA dehydrogenase family protein [Streptomyces sp. NBC_01320]